MRSYLLYRDQDFSPRWGIISSSSPRTWWRERDYEEMWQHLPIHEQRITQDLELDLLFTSMAKDDRFLFEVAKNVILTGSTDSDTIQYRQGILRDCIENPEVVRTLYTVLGEGIEQHQKIYRSYNQSVGSILHSSIQSLHLSVQILTQIREIADNHADSFHSEGFVRFFMMIQSELPDDYILNIREILEELRFPHGLFMSAYIGKGNKGDGYTLHQNKKRQKEGLIQRIFTRNQPSHYSFTIADRDYNGFKALDELRDRAIYSVIHPIGRSSAHLHAFFSIMKNELAFYIGCLNLYETLHSIGEPVCFPLPADPGCTKIISTGLYDICLAVKTQNRVVSNDLNAENKDLIIITGANRGGKSTFLRSIGLAQMMMQAGMFVAASAFSSDICTSVFTHFKREEDHTMKSGKLDEELARMSDIINLLHPGSMVLFNESFAATNEREGSEIAREIISALVQRKIKVVFVTHLYDFSHSLYIKKMEPALFLRAERLPDGERNFRVSEGEPLQTSYGPDLYLKLFADTSIRKNGGVYQNAIK